MTDISNERLDELSRYIATCSQLGDAGDGQRYSWWDRLSVLLTELKSRRASPSGVEVKGLEWVGEEGDPGMDIRAEATSEMRYTVRHLATNTFDVILNTDIGAKWFRDDGELHTSYSKAKAAAEADYRTRIMSCLTPPHSITPEGGEPVAWMITETLPSGAKRWQCVEHEFDAHQRAIMCLAPATVTPLFTSPSPNGVTVTDEMVERAWIAQREYHQSREMSYGRDGVRAALLAALEGGSQT